MRTLARLVPAVALLAAVSACADEPSTEPPPAPTSSTSASAKPSTSAAPPPSPRAGADTGKGCGQRALDKGTFNPDCKEYQGYLDPGGSGRDDTAGEAQLEYACEKGYVPKEKC